MLFSNLYISLKLSLDSSSIQSAMICHNVLTVPPLTVLSFYLELVEYVWSNTDLLNGLIALCGQGLYQEILSLSLLL